MKNVSILASIAIVLMGATILLTAPGNAFAQENMTKDDVKAKITDFATKHPKFAEAVKGITDLDLKETVKANIALEVLQKLFKAHVKNLVEENLTGQVITPLDDYMTEDEIKTKATEFAAKHPKFASVVDKISELDLKETVKAALGAEALQKLLKLQQVNLVKDLSEVK